MKIDIITASKGGTGKTSFALSCGVHYINQGQKVMFVDMNLNNADCFTVLSPYSYNSIQSLILNGRDDIKIYEEFYRVDLLMNNNNTGIALVRQTPFQLYSGIEEFYKLLIKAKKLAIDEKIDVMIVDTNFTIENLLPKKIDHTTFKDLCNQLWNNWEDTTEINIFYMWCVNDFFKVLNSVSNASNKRAEHVLDNFGEFSKDTSSVDKFTEKGNLFHVVNKHNERKVFNQKTIGAIFNNLLEKFKPVKTNENDTFYIGYTYFDVTEIIKKTIVKLQNQEAKGDDLESPENDIVINLNSNVIVLEDDQDYSNFIAKMLKETSSEKKYADKKCSVNSEFLQNINDPKFVFHKEIISKKLSLIDKSIRR